MWRGTGAEKGRLHHSSGQDIREIPAEQVLTRISLVDQEVSLFNDTVRNNIRYAHPGAADREVETACRLANCDGFIRAMGRRSSRMETGCLVGNASGSAWPEPF